MNRQNQILAVVLLLQVALAAVMFWPRQAGSVAGGESLFANLEASHITRLTIQDATGQSIELARVSEAWVLPQAGDYPVLSDKVTALLDKLAALKADRLVTQTGSSHKRLKVSEQDFERLIEIETVDGTKHKLYLGTSASYQTSHVRPGGKNEVYLASGLSASDAAVQASAWVETLYLSVPQEQVNTLSIENQQGRLAFSKNDAGAWTMDGLSAGETLDENKVKTLLSRVGSLRLLEPLGKNEQADYGLQSPSAVVSLQTRDDSGNVKSYTLRVGAKQASDSSYVVISSESAYYARVAGFNLQDVVEKGRDYFLKLPPTPSPMP